MSAPDLDLLSDDDRAWLSLAQAAERALSDLPDLSDEAQASLRRIVAAGFHAAGCAPGEADDRDAERISPTAWRRVPRVARERMLLETLGDGRMTARELLHRLYQLPDAAFTEQYTKMLLRELVAAGELEREQEPINGRRWHWVYFRRTDLSGPILDLDLAFQEPNDGREWPAGEGA